MSHRSSFQKVGSAHSVSFLKDQAFQGEKVLNRSAIMQLSAQLESLFSGPVVLTASPDWRVISVYSSAWWQELLPRLWQLPKDNALVRQFMITILGAQSELPIHVPLKIPRLLASYSSLGDEGRLLSFDQHHAELWSEELLTKI